MSEFGEIHREVHSASNISMVNWVELLIVAVIIVSFIVVGVVVKKVLTDPPAKFSQEGRVTYIPPEQKSR